MDVACELGETQPSEFAGTRVWFYRSDNFGMYRLYVTLAAAMCSACTVLYARYSFAAWPEPFTRQSSDTHISASKSQRLGSL